MEQEDIAKGFINWIGTFDSLSKNVEALNDLSDGIVLFEICAEIDRQWFKSIRSMDIGDNWILSYNNLKKLYRLVTQYYEEVLGYPATHLEAPNLSSIAKNDDKEELLKLCHLILTLAVQCEKNQVYIGKIMSLGESDQRSLMVSIESVLAQLGRFEGDSEGDGNDMDTMDDSNDNDSEDPVAKLQAELMKSYAEKSELEKSTHELSVEHEKIQNKYEELLVLNEELKVRMEELETTMANADKSGKADFLLRTEIDNLKNELEKADMRNQEAESLVNDQQQAISDLTRKLEDRDSAQEEVVRLRDQLQEYKHAAERLAKSEHVIEKYKRKLEESSDLRRQVRSLEDQLSRSQERNRQIEDEYKRVSQLRPTMDNYRDEFTQLESRHNMAVIELGQAMERLKSLETERERLQMEKQQGQEQIASLEEALHELELTGAGNARHSSDATLDKGIASAITEDDRTALLVKVSRLERELSQAKASNNGSTDATGFLEEVVDKTTQEKDAAVKELQVERELRSKLEAELAQNNEQLRAAELAIEESSRLKKNLNEVSDQLVAASSDASNARTELAKTKAELEKASASSLAIEQERNAAVEAIRNLKSDEVTNLRNENKSLEDWYSETHQQSKEFKAEVDRLSAENCELTQKLSKLQEELTKLDISKREIESESKRVQQILEHHRSSTVSTSISSQSDIERLQKELINLREGKHRLEISLKHTKDHCLKLDQELKSAQSNGPPHDDYREAIQSLQTQLAIKDEQLESMRTMLREQNNAHQLESRTMASAWFNLQRQLERQSGFGHSSGMGSTAPSGRQGSTPASWLGQQRVTLDMQLGA